MMAVNVEDKITRLSPQQRQRVVQRAEELIADEMALRSTHKSGPDPFSAGAQYASPM